MRTPEAFQASTQDGTYPRPQLLRRRWSDLSGQWEFSHDDDDAGEAASWFSATEPFPLTITVPYPPESALSGVHETGFHPVVWYRRTITRADIDGSGRTREDDRLLLHFGAVDYRATVWIDGQLVGSHEGGQSPFTFDVTGHAATGEDLVLVVRAEDDPHDVAQPRGKQDWLEDPHVIWYHRTTGIWQPVWLESVPASFIEAVAWEPDVPKGAARLELEISPQRVDVMTVRVDLSYEGRPLGTYSTSAVESRIVMDCVIPHQANGQAYESLLWSPEHPRLIDATLTLLDAHGTPVDEVGSYFGLRSVGTAGGHFLLNDRPFYVRSVLEQGYWPDSLLAAPDAAALREEVQLIKDLGFNAARLHEKVEDPRFLYWADRLGLLVWGEMGSTFEFSPTAMERVAREWASVVRRDRSHPCIVTWVPLNESWGVQQISHDPQQKHFAQAMYHLTKALDGSRPVISNDGWEHVESDIFTVHDYATTYDDLHAAYRDRPAFQSLVDGVGPAGRRLSVLPGLPRTEPVMVSEFGGILYAPNSPIETWGYSAAESGEDFARRLEALFSALQDSPFLSGFCYTQLTDTLQEANGLTDEHRKPKLPVAEIRKIVMGASWRLDHA
ncbi:glycoside hydrolase family 2 [Arthrobacter pityocampae]|uniref:Glycoside hydrolase family 2 n=1 Tax=Arthrobacter pityocampae TaxID=547334 RepID=A0A2S5ITU0_9MICC|nr:glycoside hydrolase family 2 TIM barrel-domain containing protein [Arthrobacter pityocampae]PPB47968.1 glycoside hydrolase family 2 [Arthrobacter pityocampae]